MISSYNAFSSGLDRRHARARDTHFPREIGQHLRVLALIVAQPVIGVDPRAEGRFDGVRPHCGNGRVEIRDSIMNFLDLSLVRREYSQSVAAAALDRGQWEGIMQTVGQLASSKGHRDLLRRAARFRVARDRGHGDAACGRASGHEAGIADRHHFRTRLCAQSDPEKPLLARHAGERHHEFAGSERDPGGYRASLHAAHDRGTFPAFAGGEVGRVVGMLSIGDLVKAVIQEQSEHIEQLERYIAG